MHSLKTLIALTFCFVVSFSFAQSAQQDNLSLENGSINSQFEFIFKKSGNFTGTNGLAYEAVKYNSLLKLKNNVLDSLSKMQSDLNDAKGVITSQAGEISDLKNDLTKTQTDLEKTSSQKDSMSFFGIQMSKAGYNSLLWFIIIALLALFILFVFKFKNSNIITKKAQQSLADVEDEYEEHRKRALEREQKVRRQLQDEINKQKKNKP